MCKSPKNSLLQRAKEVMEEKNEEAFNEKESMAVPHGDKGSEISLNSITSTPSPNMMRLMGKVGGVNVVIMVDSRSIHSFLDLSVAHRAKLKVTGHSNSQ